MCITNMKKKGVYGRHVAPKQYERVDKPIFKQGKKKRNKNKKRSRLTPVGGISLNSQLVRGVIGIATKKAELVEYFLRLGIHVVTEVLHANNKENLLYDHSKSAPLLRLHTADRLETPHIEF